MTRDELDARNTAAIRHHARSLADHDGRAPQALLDDLAAITDDYAADCAEDIARNLAKDEAAKPQPAPAGSAGTAGPSHRTRTRQRGQERHERP